MLDDYKDAYDEIEVPKDLIHKTSVLMKEEQEKQKEKKKFSFFSMPMLFGLGTTAAVVAIIVGVMGQSSDQLITTDLTAGQTVEEVELSDGHMVFSDNQMIGDLESIPSDSVVEKSTKDEIKAFLGESIQEVEVPEDYKLEETTYESIYENEEMINARVTYIYEYSDQILKISYQLKLDETINGNSEVNGVSCDVWYDDKSSEYGANYIKDDYIYTVVTTETSQEDFITILNMVIK